MNRIRILPLVAAMAALLGAASGARGQWDPQNGQWGRTDSKDIRVMTWNIQDNICSTTAKTEARNSWAAIARIVAAMKPDVLILQEAGDNSGNGTGNGVDTVPDLETTLDLFLHGGTDPFLGGQVTSYVQKYDPTLDLPYLFVNTETDGYNRDVILSRYPFADQNGDGEDRKGDIDYVFPDEYAPGGDGGIRGFQFAEIDLPDTVYRGDLVMGNAHLKAGSSSSDKAQRLEASQNTAYWIDYLLNGAGTGQPDPHDKIRDLPPVTSILGADTPVVLGGDWNEDEQTNGRKGPAEWLVRAQLTGGSDGTDRDRTDATYDDARDAFTGSRTTRGSSKLDYIAWQDSIALLHEDWIFDSASVPSQDMPPELEGYVGGANAASNWASDHLPVLADLALPEPDVTIDLTPHSTTVPQGGQLFFDAVATNHTGAVISAQGWVDVFDPDGSPFFASNPKFGPKSFNLQPMASKQKNNVRINVSASKPAAVGYRVKAYIGIFPNDIWATDEFYFEVTAP